MKCKYVIGTASVGTALDSHSCCCWLVVCWSVVVVVGMHASARGRKGGRASVVNLCLEWLHVKLDAFES